MFMHVCKCVYVQVHVHMHVEVKGQSLVSCFRYHLLISEIGSFTDLELTKHIGLVGHPAPGFHLPPPSQR